MEECRMQMKAEAAQLCKMLSKAQSERMPFEGVEIAKSLQRIPFFVKFFDMKSQPFINLCITSTIVEFQPSTDIYSTQEQRYIYIILEGKVNATISDNLHPREESKHCLTEFGIFGETEVLFGLDKRHQAVTASDCLVKCMVLRQCAIQQIVNPSMQRFVEKTTNYLEANDYFQELTLFEKQQLVIHFSLETFKKADTIVDIDTRVNQVYFLMYGRLLVVKNLKIKTNPKIDQYKIDELSEMDSFGEYETQNQTLSEVSLIAQTPGAYYSLDCQSLKGSNHRILKTIKQRAIPYPDQEEIQFLHEIKNSMKKQEDRVIKKNKLFS